MRLSKTFASLILECQLGQLRSHLFLLCPSGVWQGEPLQTSIMSRNKAAPLSKSFEKRFVLLLAPKTGAYPIHSSHPGAYDCGGHVPSAAAEAPRRVREHSLHIIVRPDMEHDRVHSSRQFLKSLQRCGPYWHRVAILVKDVPAILANHDESLNSLALGKLRGSQHGLVVAQEIAELTWYKIREALAGIVRLKLVQHPKGHGKVCQCKLVRNEHIHNLASCVICLACLNNARLQRAGKESEDAVQFVVKPLHNRLHHVMSDDLCHGPLRLHHVALKSLALRVLPYFPAGGIDWHIIDFRAHLLFQVRGHLRLPLLLERWIHGDFSPLAGFVDAHQTCSADPFKQGGHTPGHTVAAEPPHRSTDVCMRIDKERVPHVRPPQSHNTSMRQPHRGGRGNSSFNQPLSSIFQVIQSAATFAFVFVR